MMYEEYRAKWEEYPKEHVVSTFPLHLDIELTTRCNLSCNQCPFHDNRQTEPLDMDFALYKRIIDEAAKEGCYSIKLNYRGEPLLYDKLADAIYYAKTRGIKHVMVNTNGTLLKLDKGISLIKAGLDALILSDYGHKATHMNGMAFSAISTFLGHVKLRIKTENKEKWRGIGNEVVTSTYYDYSDLSEDFTKSEFECPIPWQRMLILANGDVCKCSCGFYDKEKVIGNLRHKRIKDLWESKEMTFLRTCHQDRTTELVRICRMCPVRKEEIINVGKS